MRGKLKRRGRKMEGKILFWFIMGTFCAFMAGFIIGVTLK